MLEFKHFDSHTGKWIQDPLKSGEIFTEKLDNTLLELYFPEGKFSFAKIDEATTETELQNNHPEGHVLLLSSKTRMVFGEKQYKERLDKILPDLKDRGAYGSIFLGSCTNTLNKKVNLLVIDDANGKNGDLLPDDFAFRLTGDCHGKISDKLYQEAFGKEYHIIQHRLGIPELNRFGKGTIAATKFEDYPWKDNRRADLIIPISSFKGGKLAPGLYEADIWLGEKEKSQLGKAAITPLYGSYPELLKDTLPTLDYSADLLRQKLNNPLALAELYCQRYEEQAKDYKEKQIENEVEEEEIVDRLERSTYVLMKAAVDGKDPSFVETPLLAEELTKFVAKEWKNNAIGKDPKLKWDRAMIIPSKSLKEGEICVSWKDEGETILNTRYPYLNSNGMGVAKNKHLEEMFAPDGSAYKGIILVPDETHDRIHERLNEIISIECEELGIDTIALKAEVLQNLVKELDSLMDIDRFFSIEDLASRLAVDRIDLTRRLINKQIEIINANGGNITETAPIETIMERQAYDFDGDNIVIANIREFPNLHQEAIEKYKSENRYAPTVKLAKQSFPNDWSFEKIALQMASSPVGAISNNLQNLTALRSEIALVREFGTVEDKRNYIQKIGRYIDRNENETKQLSDFNTHLELQNIAEIAKQPYSEANFTHISENYDRILKKKIEELSVENQIAVDMFKSAKTPDLRSLQDAKILAYRQVNAIADKKQWKIYVNRSIAPSGFSPQDILADNTNRYWSESQIQTRSLEEFGDLFDKPTKGTPEYETFLAAKLKIGYAKNGYDRLWEVAALKSIKERNEKGAILRVTTAKGNTIDLTNLAIFKHPDAYSKQPLELRIVPNEIDGKKICKTYHQFLAQAKANGNWKNLGMVCELSSQKLGLEAGAKISPVSIELINPQAISTKYYTQAQDYANSFYQNIPREELPIYAAAAWDLATKRDLKFDKQASRFVLNTFAKEIGQQMVPRTSREINFIAADGWNLEGEREIELTVDRGEERKELYHDGVLISKSIRSDGYSPPAGSRLTGKIAPLPTSTISLKIDGLGKEIIFGKADRSPLSDRAFNEETVEVTLTRQKIEPTWKIYHRGIELGELDRESKELFEAKGILREGDFTSVTAISTGEQKDNCLNTTFRTASGNCFRIVEQPIGSPRLDGQTLDLQLKSHKNLDEVTTVLFTIDGQKIKAGEFTNHPTSRQSISILQNNRLWQEGATFTAKATSRNPHYKIEVDRSSIELPLNNNLAPVSESPNLLRARIIKESIANPTLFSREGDILRLSIDNLKLEEAKNYLTAKGITFEEIEPSIEEFDRNYKILSISPIDLGEDDKQKFEEKFGKPLEGSDYERRLGEIKNNGNRELKEQIFKLSVETVERINEDLSTSVNISR